MTVNSITGDGVTFTLQPLKTAASLEQSVKGTPSKNEQSPNPIVTSSVVDANDNNKVSPLNKQTPDAGSESNKKSVRTMSHVVEVYNLQGKVRVKYMDSHNNVIYQIPSEMVAKMEDQMMKSETSTNIKG